MLSVISCKLAKKKEKVPFSYEGKTYKTNPFAVCSKDIDRKEEPETWEKCVQHVKKDANK